MPEIDAAYHRTIVVPEVLAPSERERVKLEAATLADLDADIWQRASAISAQRNVLASLEELRDMVRSRLAGWPDQTIGEALEFEGYKLRPDTQPPF